MAYGWQVQIRRPVIRFNLKTLYALFRLPTGEGEECKGENAVCWADFEEKGWGVEGQDGLSVWTWHLLLCMLGRFGG